MKKNREKSHQVWDAFTLIFVGGLLLILVKTLI